MIKHVESGSGYPLILIHGFCENSAIWNNLRRELSEEFRVLCPDLPGFGASPSLKVTTMETVAAEIKKWLDYLQIKSTVMIGHSLGGYVTLAFAELFPTRLRGFGLFHSSATADSEEKKKTRSGVAEFIKEFGVKKFINSMGPSLFNSKRKNELETSISAFMHIAYESSETAIIDYSIAIRDRKDRQKVLHKDLLPVLFISGKQDLAVPYSISVEQTINKNHISFITLENSAHMGMYEEPDRSVRLIKNFVHSSYK